MATILIVDDLSVSRKFLTTLLRYHGHRLLEAVDGREGLAVAQAELPDLVITDMFMPVMDGAEFVRQLRLDPTTSGIPVVFYTGHFSAREARALAMVGGVSDVLTKPAASAEVMRIVDRLLSGAPENSLSSTEPPHSVEFDRAHLRLVTDELSIKVGDLETANARLRAVFEIGLEFAERDSDPLLQSVCEAARELFGATYVSIGMLDRHTATLQRLFTCGTDATGEADSAHWINVGDSISGVLRTVVVERRTVHRQNPGGDPVTLQLPPLHPTAQSFLAAPIASRLHVYGWLCLVSSEGHSFTEDDEHLVTALSGQVGRIYELEREILERKETESALRHERDRAQQYLDTAEVILLELDMGGRIVLVNRYACSVLGWTREELHGRDWVETCVPLRIQDSVREKFHNLLGGGPSIVENPIVTRSGEERLIEWRNTLRRDDTGHVVGTLSSGTDITERTQAVEALRTAEERMRFALQSAAVGIWDMDYPTGVLRWSETMEAQYGLSPGAFGGTFDAFIEGIHPDDRATVLEAVGKAMKTGADFSVHSRSVWPDGTIRWLSGAGRIYLGDHGEPVRGVGISLDVTERRSLEQQYQQAQKMEAVGRLAGGVAHDFNNLLTVILGYCDLLRVDLAATDPRQADVAQIQSAGQSATRLTRQLLAFSRKQIIEPALIDVNTVVADTRSMFGRLIGEDVQIVLGLGSELSLVMADRGQIEQIIMNLAVNARDAMPNGGTLTIETANIELDDRFARSQLGAKPGPHVVLTVTDTGTGMTPHVKAHLFEPFFTTKDVGHGTGLGLATVHGIVTRSGGSISVHSEVGWGTSFKLYFPRADRSVAVAEAPPSVPRPRVGGQTVLVVEDAEGIGELTRKLLERQGYTVLVAANADEAIRLFEESASIDVLLTDVVMPGASGPDLTRQLVERRPTLKVVYMSGYAPEAIAHHGILNPGVVFLNKPFTSETLGQKIREVLEV